MLKQKKMETHEQQQQVIAVFCDMTGMSDKHKAAGILSETAWDLNEAVMVHMSNPEPGGEGIFSAVGEQVERMQIAGKETIANTLNWKRNGPKQPPVYTLCGRKPSYSIYVLLRQGAWHWILEDRSSPGHNQHKPGQI